MDSPVPPPGFLAASDTGVDRVAGSIGSAARVACGAVFLARWGLAPVAEDPGVLLLSRVVRTRDGAVASADIASELASRPAELGRLLPPFAAVRSDATGVTMVADSMGLRQLYHSESGGEGEPVMSTSALLAGRAISAGFDETAVAVQSQLGWQLGQRTLFSGVQKLAPGVVARLDQGGVSTTTSPEQSLEPISFADAVSRAAAILRASLEALLDEHPDAVLQLTGGQDSRLLLSAIPAARRRGLNAMTLGIVGDGDVDVAAEIAMQYGVRHEVRGMGRLDEIAPAEAWTLAVDAASRLDGTADPLALAALTVAERAFEQGVRISGLGGEVARGFYYVGTVRDRTYGRKDAEQLAAWRMFANESVEPDALVVEFGEWARNAANASVLDALTAGGTDWFRATDELYLRHRMQRWAGVTDTAVAYQRIVINPMLDESFLMLAARLAPQEKAHSRFLASLQMELDPELGEMRLEGRPAPIAFTEPGPLSSARRSISTARRVARKVAQRMRRGNRAPAGGVALAMKVTEHWREHPEILENSALSRFIREPWVDDVLSTRLEPRPSSVAFITNLVVASQPSPTTGSAM